MASRLPPVTWLRAFDAAARHMSFTEAARELNVTQSAISRPVRHLEDHLGQALFIRHARGITLTEAGAAYAQTVEAAFDRLLGATEEIFGPSRQAPLTVRATPGFAVYWLAPRLPDFRRMHPGISIHLATGVWARDFTGEGADLEIRYGHGTWPEVAAYQLTQEAAFPVCTPATATTLARPEDLSKHTLIHAVSFEAGWPTWLAAAGVPEIAERAPAITSDTVAATLALARVGSGVALLRSSFASAALDGELVAPFEHATELSEAFYLVWSSACALRPAAAAFRDWIVGHVTRHSLTR